jgi:hypothetical protein
MSIEEIIDFLINGHDVDAQLRAFGQLKVSVTKNDLPLLLQTIKSETCGFWVRELLSEPIIDLGGAEALPELLAALQKNYEEGHDNDSFTAFLMDLAESDPVGAREQLVKMAKTASPSELKDINWLLEYCQ